jgi:pimeloyl-ACP methyl ester carboxylesterase
MEPTEKLYIFIHGWGCTALDYLPLIQSVIYASSKVQYIAIDLRGHGESPTSLCPIPTVSAFAGLVNRLCHEVCSAQNDSAPGREVAEELAEKLSGTSSFPASSQNILPVAEIERVVIGRGMGCRIALEAFSPEPENVSGVVLLDGS